MPTRAQRSISFGAVAADYDRLRPPPADAAVDWIRVGEWFREAYEQARPSEIAEPRDSEGRRLVLLPDGSPFANIETHTFYYSRPMTPTAIVDMLTTYSSVITADPEYMALGRARGVAALATEFPGADVIELPVRSYCWRADRIAR